MHIIWKKKSKFCFTQFLNYFFNFITIMVIYSALQLELTHKCMFIILKIHCLMKHYFKIYVHSEKNRIPFQHPPATTIHLAFSKLPLTTSFWFLGNIHTKMYRWDFFF